MSNPTPHPPLKPSISGLADALFSKTLRQLLACLFGHPDRSLYTSEITALVGSGSVAIQRELLRLVQSGLATVGRIGNQRHYRIADL